MDKPMNFIQFFFFVGLWVLRCGIFLSHILTEQSQLENLAKNGSNEERFWIKSNYIILLKFYRKGGTRVSEKKSVWGRK